MWKCKLSIISVALHFSAYQVGQPKFIQLSNLSLRLLLFCWVAMLLVDLLNETGRSGDIRGGDCDDDLDLG